MRINKYIALATGMSRRSADAAIAAGRIQINGATPKPGQQVETSDVVTLDNSVITLPVNTTTLLLNKPVGYVCSRDGQGSKTVYDLLPETLHKLKPVGRLDKDSSGLLLMTNDGSLANTLTHPRYAKEKRYEVTLDKALDESDRKKIEQGIMLEDGTSTLKLTGDSTHWTVTMTEGRNRQVRRTFAALGYNVRNLHRTAFGDYQLGTLGIAKYEILN